MDAVTAAATNGLTQLQQLGLAGLFLSFIFIGGIWIVHELRNIIDGVKEELKNCRDSHSKTEQARIDDMKETRATVDRNTEAFTGVKIALAEIKVKIGG